MCIWDGPSVDAVRDLVESVVGKYSENEYYEMELDAVPVERLNAASGALASAQDSFARTVKPGLAPCGSARARRREAFRQVRTPVDES
jgi:hypothetical protein